MQPASSSNTVVGSSSSASAEEREVAANNSPQRNRRWIATGHGVQQIPETSAVLTSPQQQEQPTLSPVEQRLVAEHQSAATAYFVGAESTETGRPNPADAFAEVLSADEPMEIGAGPAAEEIPLEDIVINFLPSQQEDKETGTSQTEAVVTATQSLSSSGALATVADASPTVSPSQMLPSSLDIALYMALGTMVRDMAIEEELEHFPVLGSVELNIWLGLIVRYHYPVLGSVELEILEPWRDQMTYSQLRAVIANIDLQSVELETVLVWQETLENRRRDNLGLDLDEFLDSLLEGADD